MTTPLFNEILEKNQIIKGRLNLNKSDLEKLYLTLKKDNNRLKKKQVDLEEVIKTNLTKRNEINFQIKRNLESVQKSFYPSSNKISLLYKKQGEFHYVKARFYWGGKQREVQVGSIINLIEIINSMIINKLLSSIKIITVKKLTWEQITSRPKLKAAIKEIASLKAQEYILRRLKNEKLNIRVETDANIHKEENINVDNKKSRHNISKSKPVYEQEDESLEGVEWYKKWREENYK